MPLSDRPEKRPSFTAFCTYIYMHTGEQVFPPTRNPALRPLRAHLAVFPRESLRRLTVAFDFEGCLLSGNGKCCSFFLGARLDSTIYLIRNNTVWYL